jgi:hypothetical protein
MICTGLRTIVYLSGCLLLAGCIRADGPILSDSAQPFGEQLRLQLYGLSNGFARDPEIVSFKWNGHHYTRTGGGLRDVSGFTVHPFEGDDFIIQTVPGKPSEAAEFAIAHKLAGGVWQVTPIDEADADAATRDRFCNKPTTATCVVETREQVLAFARATAAHRGDNGGLAIRLPDRREAKKSRQR